MNTIQKKEARRGTVESYPGAEANVGTSQTRQKSAMDGCSERPGQPDPHDNNQIHKCFIFTYCNRYPDHDVLI